MREKQACTLITSFISRLDAQFYQAASASLTLGYSQSRKQVKNKTKQKKTFPFLIKFYAKTYLNVVKVVLLVTSYEESCNKMEMLREATFLLTHAK